MPYILILFIFVNLFAPIGLELNNNKIVVKKNVASAVENISANDPTAFGTIWQGLRTKAKGDCLDTPSTTPGKEFCFATRVISQNSKATLFVYVIGKDWSGIDGYHMNLEVTDTDGTAMTPEFSSQKLAPIEKYVTEDQDLTANYTNPPAEKYDGRIFSIENITNFTEGKTYNFNVTIEKGLVGSGDLFITAALGPVAGTAYYLAAGQESKGKESILLPNVSISTTQEQGKTPVATGSNTKNATAMPECSMNPLAKGTFMGCVAQGIYYVLFQTTSYVFALTGTLFDNAFAYSVDDNSYRSPFVVEGWGVVRDFCNMFFIFILLYIAFGTILNLNSVKTKEMIINVVLIGIFINFSLFATRVIIDASNILARVFYNSNTITVTMEDSAVGANVIPLSAALVNKINPQAIILSASQVNVTKDTRGKGDATSTDPTNSQQSETISVGTFILVTLLATAVNVVGIFVFFSISFIFIGRVVGLWLAMILVPFAFLSYTVPAMQDIEMIGWKKWWPETLKLAFLAPIFIFFLYLIIQFLDTGLGLIKTDQSAGGLSFMIGIILPFAFIMILLLKAKDIATKMSGTIGEMASKIGSAVGGLAVGAATGGVGMIGRATLGRAGSALATNEGLNADAAKGKLGAKMLLGLGKAGAAGSFDARSTKLGGMAGKATGMNMGEAKGKGGFDKMKADKIEKDIKRAKELEPGENSVEKQKLNQEQAGKQALLRDNAHELEIIEKIIAAKTQASSVANATLLANPTDAGAKIAAQIAAKEMNKAIQDKKNIRDGGLVTVKDPTTGLMVPETDANGNPTNRYNTSNGLISEAAADKIVNDTEEQSQKAERDAREEEASAALILASTTATQTEKDDARAFAEQFRNIANNAKQAFETAKVVRSNTKTGKSINDFDLKSIPDAEKALAKKTSERRFDVAEDISSTSSKIKRLIISGGQSSAAGANEAAHKIIMNTKVEAGK